MKLYLLSIIYTDDCTYSNYHPIGVFKSEGHAKQASVQHCNAAKKSDFLGSPIEDYYIKEIEVGVLFD